MNTNEIHQALLSNSITTNHFRGVFASDKIKIPLYPLPGSCIVNIDPSTKPGRHWIGLHQEVTGVIKIWDSFGKDFSMYNPFFASISKENNIVSQSQKFQSINSTACGQNAMFFVHKRAEG